MLIECIEVGRISLGCSGAEARVTLSPSSEGTGGFGTGQVLSLATDRVQRVIVGLRIT